VPDKKGKKCCKQKYNYKNGLELLKENEKRI
jgi:hypothetical protein